MQCIVVKSGEFENSYSLLYIFFLNPVYVAARSLRSNKLRHYDVRGIVIYWFTSYLTGRKQISIFNGNSSQAILSCRANDAHARGVDVWHSLRTSILNVNQTFREYSVFSHQWFQKN